MHMAIYPSAACVRVPRGQARYLVTGWLVQVHDRGTKTNLHGDTTTMRLSATVQQLQKKLLE